MKNYEYYYLAKRNLLKGSERRTRVYKEIKRGDHIHISAVCGKAMASVAVMLKNFGCIVTGSDTKFSPPMSGVLKTNGIVCLEPSVDNLKDTDIVVVGNSLSYDSLEVTEARKRGIPMLSGSEVLAQIFSNKRSLVVAGTHGKTTTSALLTHVFLQTQKEPAYMIGGVFQNSEESSSAGKENGGFVIYEGDEYNCAFFDQAPKFLRYKPNSVILTSIEHDHVDLYPTPEDYKQAFQFLIEDLPKDGHLIIHTSAASIIDTSRCVAKVLTYGSSELADISYTVLKTDIDGTHFSLRIKNNVEIGNIKLPMFGVYNVENAVAVYALSILEGITQTEIIKALENYPGTKERQEFVGESNDGTVVIRDYAHHPTAVSLTIDGLKMRYPDRKIVAVFEPRSASSKRKIFETRYAEALAKADIAIIINPENQTIPESDQINIFNVKKAIDSFGKKSWEAKSNDEALDIVIKIASHKDVILFMSSGDMNGIPNKFLERASLGQ